MLVDESTMATDDMSKAALPRAPEALALSRHPHIYHVDVAVCLDPAPSILEVR